MDTVKRFYGEEPRSSPDYCRIISQMHTERLDVMMKDTPGRIILGGTVDVDNRYVEPTLVAGMYCILSEDMCDLLCIDFFFFF